MGAYRFDPEHCPVPGTYCVAKEDAAGCVPTIALRGEPSASGASFLVAATGLGSAQAGFLWVSRAPAALPMADGVQCVAAAGRWTLPAQVAPGRGACSNQLRAWLRASGASAGGLGAIGGPGDRHYVQFVYRNAAGQVGHSEGLEFLVCP